LKTNEDTVRKKIGSFADKIMPKVKGYVKENWGTPFIVGFMALLLVAAVSLSMGFSVFADDVAVYAYYALVVGVVLQFACFWKYRNKKDEPSQ
jgi:amino acid transporter